MAKPKLPEQLKTARDKIEQIANLTALWVPMDEQGVQEINTIALSALADLTTDQ